MRERGRSRVAENLLPRSVRAAIGPLRCGVIAVASMAELYWRDWDWSALPGKPGLTSSAKGRDLPTRVVLTRRAGCVERVRHVTH